MAALHYRYISFRASLNQLIQPLVHVQMLIAQQQAEAAGREKVIWTQLDSKKRVHMALQGVNHSAYNMVRVSFTFDLRASETPLFLV